MLDNPNIQGGAPAPDKFDLHLDNPQALFGDQAVLFDIPGEGNSVFGMSKIDSAAQTDEFLKDLLRLGGTKEPQNAQEMIKTARPDDPIIFLDPQNPSQAAMLDLVQQNIADQKGTDYDTHGHTEEDSKTKDDYKTGENKENINPATGEPYIAGVGEKGQSGSESGQGDQDPQRDQLTAAGSGLRAVKDSPIAADNKANISRDIKGLSDINSTAAGGSNGPNGGNLWNSPNLAVAYILAQFALMEVMKHNKVVNQEIILKMSDIFAGAVKSATLAIDIQAKNEAFVSQMKIAGAVTSIAISSISLGMSIKSANMQNKAQELKLKDSQGQFVKDKEGKLIDTPESKRAEASAAQLAAGADAATKIGSSINQLIVSAAELAVVGQNAAAKQTQEWSKMLEDIARQISGVARDAINQTNIQQVIDQFRQILEKMQQAWIQR